MHILFLLPIVLLMTFSSTLHAYTVVIVNPTNPDSTITKKIAKKIFMGKSNSTGSTEVMAVDQEEDSAVRNDFFKKAANKDPDKMKNYWSKMIFSGRAIPPEIKSGDAAVIDWVSEHKDAIGYIDSNSITSTVKVILELP